MLRLGQSESLLIGKCNPTLQETDDPQTSTLLLYDHSSAQKWKNITHPNQPVTINYGDNAE